MREDLRDQTTERVTNEQERRWYVGSLKQRVQLLRDASSRPRQRAGVAPSEARAIVAAHACQCGELGLDKRPADRRRAEGSVENDGRGSVASAVQVETESTDVYKPARRSDRTHTFRIRRFRIPDPGLRIPDPAQLGYAVSRSSLATRSSPFARA